MCPGQQNVPVRQRLEQGKTGNWDFPSGLMGKIYHGRQNVSLSKGYRGDPPDQQIQCEGAKFTAGPWGTPKFSVKFEFQSNPGWEVSSAIVGLLGGCCSGPVHLVCSQPRCTSSINRKAFSQTCQSLLHMVLFTISGPDPCSGKHMFSQMECSLMQYLTQKSQEASAAMWCGSVKPSIIGSIGFHWPVAKVMANHWILSAKRQGKITVPERVTFGMQLWKTAIRAGRGGTLSALAAESIFPRDNGLD